MQQVEGNSIVSRKKLFLSEKGIIKSCKLSTQPPVLRKILLKLLGFFKNEASLVVVEGSNALYKQHKLKKILNQTIYNVVEIQDQVKIGPYHVDFLIINKIIIDCDEIEHKDRNEDYEKDREQFPLLQGYTILHYDSGNEDESVFTLINQVLKIKEVINNGYSLQLAESSNFDDIECDLYEDKNNDIWMTRWQIGETLG